MSKYDPLWVYVQKSESPSLQLTFDQIREVLGFELDHSFLNFKKELLRYGYQVDNISLKAKTVSFIKTV